MSPYWCVPNLFSAVYSEGIASQKFTYESNTRYRYCCLNETIVQIYTDFFESKTVYTAKDSILFLCLCTSVFIILCSECKHPLCLMWAWVALGFIVARIILHLWLHFDVHYLIGHGSRLDDLVQHPLQLQLWERWADHSILPQGLGSTGPPSNC